MRFLFFLCLSILAFSCQTSSSETVSSAKQEKIKVLIVDGENNHGVWPMTTMMMKDYLQESGLFTVDIARPKYLWCGPHYDKRIGLEDINELLTMYPLNDGVERIAVEEPKMDSTFNPNFKAYDLVVSNMGWKASNWMPAVKTNFENFISNGGGLVILHAADNSWGDWLAYNKMIGLGGWGGRSKASGPYVYYDDQNVLQRDTTEGACGSHGPQQEFVLTNRAPEHPIMKGIPAEWLHTEDEMYDRLRGPAENMTVLATAYSDVEKNGPPWNKEVKGSGRHEPMLMCTEYGKGRGFHTTLGHMDYSMECVGFITTFLRGAEWAATGKVTQAIPNDFPTKDKISARAWKKK